MLEVQEAVRRADVIVALLPKLEGSILDPPAFLEIGDPVVSMHRQVPQSIGLQTDIKQIAAHIVENHCSIGNGIQPVSCRFVCFIRLLGYHLAPVEQIRVGVVCGDEEGHVAGVCLLVGVVVYLNVENWILGFIVGD